MLFHLAALWAAFVALTVVFAALAAPVAIMSARQTLQAGRHRAGDHPTAAVIAGVPPGAVGPGVPVVAVDEEHLDKH